jgi:hypothetical protein
VSKWDKRLAAFDYGDEHNPYNFTPQQLDEAVENLQRELVGKQDPDCVDCFLHTRSILETLQRDRDGYPVTYPTSPCTH